MANGQGDERQSSDELENISQIMKKALPANVMITTDAVKAVQEGVSEFISFITGEASEKCRREKREMIDGDDLLWSVMVLGFEDYVYPLKRYLARYREMEVNTKGSSSNSADGVQLNPSSQFVQIVHQSSFPQGMNNGNSQVLCSFTLPALPPGKLVVSFISEESMKKENEGVTS